MTTHKKEAERALQDMKECVTLEAMRACLMTSQGHAMLALVDELQRIHDTLRILQVTVTQLR